MAEAMSDGGTARLPRCPSCGAANIANLPICVRCGQPLDAVSPQASSPPPAVQPSAQLSACPQCRKPLPADSKFCPFCGLALPASLTDEPSADTVKIAVPRIGASTPGRPFLPAEAISAPTAEHAVPAAGRAAGPGAPAVPKIEVRVTELKTDGSMGETRAVAGELSIGREGADVNYPADGLLSPRHATLTVRDGKLYLKDAESRNGTFLKQRHDSELGPGDVFLLGRDLFRFATQSLEGEQNVVPNLVTQYVVGAPRLQRGPVTARLEHIQLDGKVIEEFSLEKPETTIGRTRGDLVFRGDPYMSGIHARVVAQPGRFLLQDMKSKNGVYRKIRQEVELRDADEFFLGEQLFRVQIRNVIA